MHFLAGFSQPFALALGLWPVASLVLTLPVLAILYRRDGRLRFWSAVGAYLSVLYLVSLVCFTLYPLPSGDSGLGFTYGTTPQLDFWAFVDDIRRDGRPAVLQLVANVVFFIPFGFIVGRGLRKGIVLASVLGFLASLFVETAQLTGLFWIYPYSYRTFDVDDLACNTLGAVIGWCMAAVLNWVLPTRRDDAGGLAIETRPSFMRRTVAFCLDMTFVLAAWGVVCAGVLLSGVLAQALAESHARMSAAAAWVAGIEGNSGWAYWLFITMFLLVELVIPWLRAGQTPGGSFVRMTCESHYRPLPRRILFYALRLAAFVCTGLFAPIAIPVLAIFYAAARKMPYDFV